MAERPSPTPNGTPVVRLSPDASAVRASAGPPVRDDAWEASWEATRRRKFVIALDATPAQRLLWLEQMIQLAHLAGALPRPPKR